MSRSTPKHLQDQLNQLLLRPENALCSDCNRERKGTLLSIDLCYDACLAIVCCVVVVVILIDVVMSCDDMMCDYV